MPERTAINTGPGRVLVGVYGLLILVYIILSRKTREEAYQKTLELLTHSFPTWDDLLASPRVDVERLVHGGGAC